MELAFDNDISNDMLSWAEVSRGDICIRSVQAMLYHLLFGGIAYIVGEELHTFKNGEELMTRFVFRNGAE